MPADDNDRRLPILPEAVTRVAYHSRNGEMAWRKHDLPAALAAIADSGQAILGVELWLAQGDGLWDCIPWIYDTAPRAEGESWPSFCRRTADEMAQEVGGWRLEELAIPPRDRDRVFFNLTYVTEAEASS